MEHQQAKVLDVERLVAAVQMAYSTNSVVRLKKDKNPGAQFSYIVTLGKGEQHVGFAQKRGSLFSFFDVEGTFLTEVDISDEPRASAAPPATAKALPQPEPEDEEDEEEEQQQQQAAPAAQPPQSEGPRVPAAAAEMAEEGRVATCRFCLAANLRGARQCRKCGKTGGLVDGMPTLARAASKHAVTALQQQEEEMRMEQETEADRVLVAVEMEAWKRREEEERLEQLLAAAERRHNGGVAQPQQVVVLQSPAPSQAQPVRVQPRTSPPQQQQQYQAPPPLPSSSPPPSALRFQKMPTPQPSEEILSPRQRRAREKQEKKAAKERAKRGVKGTVPTPLSSLEPSGDHVIGEPFNFQHLQGQSTHFQDAAYLAKIGADASRLGSGARPPLLRSFSDSALEAPPSSVQMPQPRVQQQQQPQSAQPPRPAQQQQQYQQQQQQQQQQQSPPPHQQPASAPGSGRLSPRRPTAPPSMSQQNSPMLQSRSATVMERPLGQSSPVVGSGGGPRVPMGQPQPRQQQQQQGARQGQPPRLQQQEQHIQQQQMHPSRSPRGDKPWSNGTYTDPRTGTVWVYDKAAKAWQKQGRVAVPQQQPQQQQQQQQAAPAAGPRAVVLFDFPAKHPSHLSVVRGERVVVCAGVWPDARGWTRVTAERGGGQASGVVPESYLRREAGGGEERPAMARSVTQVRGGHNRPASLDSPQRARDLSNGALTSSAGGEAVSLMK